jgi:WD40 repeat protein/serine/threonine protein kinase
MSLRNLEGQSLGKYRLRSLIGMGAMGVVYRAHQPELNREVAVKILSPTWPIDDTYVERFQREVEIASSLEHPHIVPVYDFGNQADISFVVMRLLHGGSLAERVRCQESKSPSLSEIANILNQLAGALDYAHTRHIIHRDLKPNNIMFDEHGNAYIIDFGLAKLALESVSLSQSNQVIGTPLYMAPEQWLAQKVTPATDQYSLGVIIYQLIAGCVPFKADTPYGLMHKHINEEPPSLQTYRDKVPDDLNRVLERALAKKDRDRFPTVTGFAQAYARAVQGFTGDESQFFTRPIERPKIVIQEASTSNIQLRNIEQKSVLRKRLWWLAVIVTAAIVMAVLVVISSDRRQGNETGLLTETANVVGLQPSLTLPADTQIAATGSLPITALSPDTIPFAADKPTAVAYVPDLITSVDQMAPIAAANAGQIRQVATLQQEGPQADAVTWSPDGALLAVANIPGVFLYDVSNLKASPRYIIHGLASLNTMAWSPDNGKLAFAGEDNLIRVINVADGSAWHDLTEHTNDVNSVAWSPDGAWLASGSSDGSFYIWNGNTGEGLTRVKGQARIVTDIAWSPYNVWLATATSESVSVWGVRTQQFRFLWQVPATSLAWSSDGKMIAFVEESSGGQVRDATNGQLLYTLPPGILDVAFSPDNTLLSTANRDGSIHLLNMSTGSEAGILTGHTGAVKALTWAPDSHSFVSMGEDGTVSVWGIPASANSAGTPQPPLPTVSTTALENKPITSDNEYTITAANANQVIHLARWQENWTWIDTMAWSPDGKRLGVYANHPLWLFDPYDLEAEPQIVEMDYMIVSTMAWSPDGTQLALAGSDGFIRLVNMVGTPSVLRELTGHANSIESVAWSPDGSLLASASGDRTVRIWDPQTGQTLRIFEGHEEGIKDLAWSSDSRQLISGGDTTVRMWDVTSGEIRLVFERDEYTGVDSIAWSSDGLFIAAAYDYGNIQIWNTNTQQTFFLGPERVHDVAFNPDGTLLATANDDNSIGLWEVATEREIYRLERHTGPVIGVEWSPDGSYLASISDDGTVRLWGLPREE